MKHTLVGDPCRRVEVVKSRWQEPGLQERPPLRKVEKRVAENRRGKIVSIKIRGVAQGSSKKQ